MKNSGTTITPNNKTLRARTENEIINDDLFLGMLEEIYNAKISEKDNSPNKRGNPRFLITEENILKEFVDFKMANHLKDKNTLIREFYEMQGVVINENSNNNSYNSFILERNTIIKTLLLLLQLYPAAKAQIAPPPKDCSGKQNSGNSNCPPRLSPPSTGIATTTAESFAYTSYASLGTTTTPHFCVNQLANFRDLVACVESPLPSPSQSPLPTSPQTLGDVSTVVKETISNDGEKTTLITTKNNESATSIKIIIPSTSTSAEADTSSSIEVKTSSANAETTAKTTTSQTQKSMTISTETTSRSSTGTASSEMQIKQSSTNESTEVTTVSSSTTTTTSPERKSTSIETTPEVTTIETSARSSTTQSAEATTTQTSSTVATTSPAGTSTSTTIASTSTTPEQTTTVSTTTFKPIISSTPTIPTTSTTIITTPDKTTSSTTTADTTISSTTTTKLETSTTVSPTDISQFSSRSTILTGTTNSSDGSTTTISGTAVSTAPGTTSINLSFSTGSSLSAEITSSADGSFSISSPLTNSEIACSTHMQRLSSDSSLEDVTKAVMLSLASIEHLRKISPNKMTSSVMMDKYKYQLLLNEGLHCVSQKDSSGLEINTTFTNISNPCGANRRLIECAPPSPAPTPIPTDSRQDSNNLGLGLGVGIGGGVFLISAIAAAVYCVRRINDGIRRRLDGGEPQTAAAAGAISRLGNNGNFVYRNA